MTERQITMTAEQRDDIEAYIVALMHAGERQRAHRMMNLALSYKFARDLEPPLPPNVYPLVTHAGDDWSRRVGS
jgi:hypothetical protein